MHAILWSKRYEKSAIKAPRHVLRALEKLHPNVRLDWHQEWERWTLWHRDGLDLELIAVLRTPEDGYVDPTLENTVGLLDRILTTNLIHAGRNIDQWLEEIDEAGQDGIRDIQRRAQERIHEGSERLYSLLAKPTAIRVDKGEA